MGIEPHWALFCHCFDVLPQLDQKVTDNLWIKAADKSPFFHIDLPSNVLNWAKKWFYVNGCSAPPFSHKLIPPLPITEKEDLPESELEEVDELKSDLQD